MLYRPFNSIIGCAMAVIAGTAVCTAVATTARADSGGAGQTLFSISDSATVNAAVESIDMASRTVVLLAADGELIEFAADEDMRNLSQLQVGDIVTAEFVESLVIELYASGSGAPEASRTEALTRAEEGDKPAMTAVETDIQVATVAAIDIDANSFSLRDANGDVQQFTARNPQYLQMARAGDQVVMTSKTMVEVVVTSSSVE